MKTEIKKELKTVGLFRKKIEIFACYNYHKETNTLIRRTEYLNLEDLQNDIPHGRQTYFYPDGTTASTLEYHKGKLRGKECSYFKDGELEDTAYWWDDEEVSFARYLLLRVLNWIFADDKS